MDFRVLNNPTTEQALVDAGLNSLEEVAVYNIVHGLTSVAGIGAKKSEQIITVLKENDIKTELTGEERLLLSLFEGNLDDDYLYTCGLDEAQKEIVANVLDTLKDREKDIIKRRFGFNDIQPQTLAQVAEDYDTSREIIRKIEAKALRALRSPNRLNKLRAALVPLEELKRRKYELEVELHRVCAAIKAYAEVSPDEEAGEDMRPIETLDLSVRAYNCLRRAGIKTVGKVKAMRMEDLLHVRNLGRKCAEEIVTKLANY